MIRVRLFKFKDNKPVWSYFVINPEAFKHICRASGFYDREGKEIFQDDIIAELYENSDGTFEEYRRYHVQYYEGAFWVDDDYTLSRLFKGCKEIKVLGNIYDNPTLLEKIED